MVSLPATIQLITSEIQLWTKEMRLEKMNMTTSVPHKTNSVALARKRTIPTERPPLVGEVTANFC
jgi:hypothetical protein